MAGAVIVWSLMAAAVILMIVERRIRKKPESEQTDREKRFMKADMSVGRSAQAAYAPPVVNAVVVAVGITILVVGVVSFASGHFGGGLVAVLGGAAALMYGLMFFLGRSRHTDRRGTDGPSSRP